MPRTIKDINFSKSRLREKLLNEFTAMHPTDQGTISWETNKQRYIDSNPDMQKLQAEYRKAVADLEDRRDI